MSSSQHHQQRSAAASSYQQQQPPPSPIPGSSTTGNSAGGGGIGTPNKTPQTKGLPGFLRRSLRNPPPTTANTAVPNTPAASPTLPPLPLSDHDTPDDTTTPGGGGSSGRRRQQQQRQRNGNNNNENNKDGIGGIGGGGDQRSRSPFGGRFRRRQSNNSNNNNNGTMMTTTTTTTTTATATTTPNHHPESSSPSSSDANQTPTNADDSSGGGKHSKDDIGGGGGGGERRGVAAVVVPRRQLFGGGGGGGRLNRGATAPTADDGGGGNTGGEDDNNKNNGDRSISPPQAAAAAAGGGGGGRNNNGKEKQQPPAAASSRRGGERGGGRRWQKKQQQQQQQQQKQDQEEGGGGGDEHELHHEEGEEGESRRRGNKKNKDPSAGGSALDGVVVAAAEPGSTEEASGEGGTTGGGKSYKVITFEKTISAPVVNLRDLRKLAWNGIPAQYRADSWKILLGYLPGNASRRSATLTRKRSDYADAIRQHYLIDDTHRTIQEQETLRQVLVDVPRTAPDIGLFRNHRVRRCLERLLYIWAMRHPASSYVQGINDLATPLFSVFLSGYFDGRDCSDGMILDERLNGDGTPSTNDHDDDHHDIPTPNELQQQSPYRVSDEILSEIEADCYWCLTKLLAGIQDHYTCDQPGVQRMVGRLEELVHRIDADLCTHLRLTGIEFMQFAFKWMNCLLLREFQLNCVIRLWDTYLSEGDGGFEDFHVYVCAAFLCQFSSEVQTMEFDELFGFMQNMPTDDWGDKEVEVLLSQAFVLSTLFGGSDAHLTRTD